MKAAFFATELEAIIADNQLESEGYITSNPFQCLKVNPQTEEVETIWGIIGLQPDHDFNRLGCWLETESEDNPKLSQSSATDTNLAPTTETGDEVLWTS